MGSGWHGVGVGRGKGRKNRRRREKTESGGEEGGSVVLSSRGIFGATETNFPIGWRDFARRALRSVIAPVMRELAKIGVFFALATA